MMYHRTPRPDTSDLAPTWYGSYYQKLNYWGSHDVELLTFLWVPIENQS